MIEFGAPGKVVLWGEYAVLAGAPAMVMAVDRIARCRIEARTEGWRCQSSCFESIAATSSKAALSAGEVPIESVARVVAAVVQQIPQAPVGADVFLDTSEFYRTGRKLGIGSSAAICVAAYHAVAALAGVEPNYPDALACHRNLQGPAGSGIDVAAAYSGGLQRFQDGSSSPQTLPAGLLMRFIWTGTPADTTDHVNRFETWRAQHDIAALAALGAASEALFRQTTIAALQHYVDCLQELDNTAQLGIYDSSHAYLDTLANDHQVVYKPCGAGGGDIGVAFSDDAERLIAFMSAAEQRFEMLPLEIAEYGIRATRE
ncbi:MAG: hypothetical protein V3T18_08980 [Pseudomonadales bacterium]